MGSQGFEPRQVLFSYAYISSKTTGVPDDAWLHYNPTHNIQ